MADPATTPLHLTTCKLPAGTSLHRIHQNIYGAIQFNPGVKGNARFSPIADPAGNAIPTLYAGDTFDCAAMESIFHDVPYTPGFNSVAKGKLTGQVHSEVTTVSELILVDLRTMALRKLGMQRKDLIDTEKDCYPATRAVAAQIHDQQRNAQGLLWTSRQDDSARSVVLFGDRIAPGSLQEAGNSRDLVNDATAYEAVLNLAERIGVEIVPGV